MKNWIVAGLVICTGFLAMPAQAETIYVCHWLKVSKPLVGFSKAYSDEGGRWVRTEATIESDRVTLHDRVLRDEDKVCGTICEVDFAISLVPYKAGVYLMVNTASYARNSCKYRSYKGATCKSYSPGDLIESGRCRYQTK